MNLPRFEYRLVKRIQEAIHLVTKNPDACFLAGGTDLFPQMRVGKRRPGLLIDLKGIPELGRIRSQKNGDLVIGAAVPLANIAGHVQVKKQYPLLTECCQAVGAYALRHRATMAGNICNASPAADTAVALVALEAVLRVVGPKGRRSVAAHEFFLGPGKTALKKGELLAEIVLPKASRGLSGQYFRLSRRKGMDLATVGVLVGVYQRRKNDRFRVVLAAVAPTPLRVIKAEQLMEQEGTGGVMRAAEIARGACRPISDVRGSAEYRRDMVGVLVRRGLTEQLP